MDQEQFRKEMEAVEASKAARVQGVADDVAFLESLIARDAKKKKGKKKK